MLNQISIIWNGQVSGSATYQDASLVKQVVGILLEKSPLHHTTSIILFYVPAKISPHYRGYFFMNLNSSVMQ